MLIWLANFGQIILEYWFQLLEVLIKPSDGWDYFYNSETDQRMADSLHWLAVKIPRNPIKMTKMISGCHLVSKFQGNLKDIQFCIIK